MSRTRPCSDCGEMYPLVGYSTTKCLECRKIGTCVECGGRTRRTGNTGKVPTICSSECWRARCARRARERYGADDAARNYRNAKARPVVVCKDCSSPIPYVKGGRRSTRCDTCWPVWNATRLSEKERRRSWRRQGIAITLQRYQEMLVLQANRCATCGDEFPRLLVDHDHETGAVRELLCNNCNIGLGVGRDDPALLRQWADYIEKHRAA